MKHLANALLFVALACGSTAAYAGSILLEPAAESQETPLFTSVGSWTANGTDKPLGVSIRIKPVTAGASLTWKLENVTAAQTYVAVGTYTITEADWLSLPPPDAQGYKTLSIAELNGAWGVPTSGDEIQFTLFSQPASFHTWTTLTGSTSGGTYALTAPVPEPSTLLLALPALLFLRKRR